MAENTTISWANDTFNPWMGCTKVSPACDGCYAEALMDLRHHQVKWGPGEQRVRTVPSNWAKPLKWEREEKAKMDSWLTSVRQGIAGPETMPPARFVFCASLADVFDNAVPWEWRRDLFDLIRKTPHLTWLLLTKRPGNIPKMFAETITPELRAKYSGIEHLGRSLWPSNAAMLCTVVTQEEADRDIPKLLAAKAGLKPAFAGVSVEPMLAPMNLKRFLATGVDPIFPKRISRDEAFAKGLIDFSDRPALDWVITGGETDQGKHRARPSHPDWFRSLRDQCAATGVSFHFKQWGEWLPGQNEVYPKWDGRKVAHHQDGTWGPKDVKTGNGYVTWDAESNLYEGLMTDKTHTVAAWACRVGKKAAGRALDGVVHDARPEIAR